MLKYVCSTSFCGFAALCSLAFVAVPANAQNLVADPGFESGDLAFFWNPVAAIDGSNFFVDNGSDTGITPHSGTEQAAFGATSNEYDIISQSLTTTPGTSYTLSFWLANPTSTSFEGPGGLAVDDDFQALVDGNVLIDQSGSTSSYTLFTTTFTATSTSTLLTFQSYNAPAYYALDDVSVVSAAPEPGSLALLGIVGLPIVAGVVRRRK